MMIKQKNKCNEKLGGRLIPGRRCICVTHPASWASCARITDNRLLFIRKSHTAG